MKSLQTNFEADFIPSVSVITPCYNAACFISETIESVLSQDFFEWEMLIIDDCSSDESREVVESYCRFDERIKLVRLDKNMGAAYCRNVALEASTAKYVAFLDSDDLWKPNKLSSQLEVMEAGVVFSCTGYRQFFDSSDLETGVLVDVAKVFEMYSYEDLLAKKITVGCCTVMLRREAIRNTKMPSIRSGQDYAFWLELCRENKLEITLIPDVLSYYRLVRGSISSNKLKKAKSQWLIYRRLEKLSLIRALFFFGSYAVRALVQNTNRLVKGMRLEK